MSSKEGGLTIMVSGQGKHHVSGKGKTLGIFGLGRWPDKESIL